MPNPRINAKPIQPKEWSRPLTKLYEEITDEILVNIAKRFNVADDTGSAVEWQFKKLAQMGKLTNETIRLIAKKTGQTPELIEQALMGAGLEAIKDMEPALKESVKKGLLEEAPQDMTSSVKRTMSAYAQQARSQLNMVNTRMLTSTLEQYQKVVANTLAIERQLDKAQETLNRETGNVVLGISSRTQAVRKAVKNMANEGITGFIDRSGRKWSAEAYVNMDIRTTAGNVATQATMNRNMDYGNDLVSIPILATARPLCYPWQGKVISTSNRSGYTEDLRGNQIPIYPLNKTSYGEPAGLWGINCHHTPPNVFIPGYSFLRGSVPPKETNDKRYEESQKQRQLERDIRYAKRDALIADAMGDKEAFDKAAFKVKTARNAYAEFIKDTGRTERLERTQVNGYNRSVSGKAIQAAKQQNEKKEYIANIKPTLPKANAPLQNTKLKETINVDVITKSGQNLHSIIPTESEITNVRVIAGYGVTTNIRKAKDLVMQYGGQDYKWSKLGGLVKTDNFIYDVHWYQYNGNAYEYKIKEVKEYK
nr:MAG TPA: minor capsid protein [Caudoviricetes sp.]